jgi:hypothetical protein
MPYFSEAHPDSVQGAGHSFPLVGQLECHVIVRVNRFALGEK